MSGFWASTISFTVKGYISSSLLWFVNTWFIWIIFVSSRLIIGRQYVQPPANDDSDDDFQLLVLGIFGPEESSHCGKFKLLPIIAWSGGRFHATNQHVNWFVFAVVNRCTHEAKEKRWYKWDDLILIVRAYLIYFWLRKKDYFELTIFACRDHFDVT